MPSVSECGFATVTVLMLVVGHSAVAISLGVLTAGLWWARGAVSNKEHDFIESSLHMNRIERIRWLRRGMWFAAASLVVVGYNTRR